MKRIATYSIMFVLTLGIAAETAHAFNPGLIHAKRCSILKEALDKAEKNVRQCIERCRKKYENSGEDLTQKCGISVPNIPFEPGSQCQGSYQAYLDALVAFSQCNPPRLDPLLPRSGLIPESEL
jgi:hypothetical protein